MMTYFHYLPRTWTINLKKCIGHLLKHFKRVLYRNCVHYYALSLSTASDIYTIDVGNWAEFGPLSTYF